MRNFRSNDPILNGLELDEVHAGRAFELIAQDFADAAGWRDHRRNGRRKRGILQPVRDLLAHEIVIAAIFELQADKTEREDCVGADVGQARRTGDRDLQRNSDIAFDFLGRLAGILRDDLDDRWRRVGIGLDIERYEGGVADANKTCIGDQHQRPPRQAERHQTAQHGSVSFPPQRDRRTGYPCSRRISPSCRPSITWIICPLDSPGLDVTPFDRFVVARDPDMSGFTVVDDCIARNGRRTVSFAGEDGDTRKHFGTQQMLRIVDRSAHQ